MQIKQGAGVYSANGNQVGHIDRVVIDPRTKEVTHVVVQKGLLFTEDKVVPIEMIASASEDRVTLQEHAGDLQGLPEFKEEHYVIVDEDEMERTQAPAYFAPPVYWYPFYGSPSIGYAGYPYPPYKAETEENIPEETVALKEGAEVVSADGEQVGKVERVLIDSERDQATHFLISEGLLFKEKKLIPTNWVNTIFEDQIHLAVGSQILENLPEYRE